MTYNVNIMGYHTGISAEEQKEAERNLVDGLVGALELDGGTVSQFSFTGNYVKVDNFEDAKKVGLWSEE